MHRADQDTLQSFKLKNVRVFNTGLRPEQSLSQNAEIEIIQSFPFTKISIKEFGLLWELTPDTFTPSILIPNSFNYKDHLQSYCIILESSDFLALKKALESPKKGKMMELEELQQQMIGLTVSSEIFKGHCNILKPYQAKKVQFKIVERENKKKCIIVDKSVYEITDEFDFHFDKFVNTLTWYNQNQQRAFVLDFSQNQQDFLKIEKDLISICNKMDSRSELLLFSEVNNNSDVFCSDDREEIFSMLFTDMPAFDSNILEQYDQRSELSHLDIGSKLPRMMVESIKTKLQINSGGIIMSTLYNFMVVFKNQYMCIYISSESGVDKHNEVFSVSHPNFGKLTPGNLLFTADEKCLVFSNKGSNVVALWDIQNGVLVDAVQVGAKKQVVKVVTANGTKFYALTSSEVIEIHLINKRLVVKNSKVFNKNWNLQSITVTSEGSISTGSEDGTIRVYSDMETKKSLNNFSINKPITDLSFSKNHLIAVATTKQKLFMYVLSQNPFNKRLGVKQKNGTYLKISYQDRQKFKVKQLNYQKARLMVSDSYIVSFSDNLLIVWEVKKILHNNEKSYKILDLKERILGFDAKSQKEIVVNMEVNIEIVTLG